MKIFTALLTLFLTLPTLAWDLGKLGKFQFQKLSEHVYIMYGPLAEPNKDNQGFMNNPAIVSTDKGLILIDPGSTYEVGKAVINEIKKISDKPIIAVFNTHIHGDHWFANHAVKEIYPKAKFYAHPSMIKQANGEKAITWLNSMHRMTEGLSKSTQITPPTIPLIDQQKIIIDGHNFSIYHFRTSHTDTDIMIKYHQDNVIFLGDNGFNGRFGQFDESASIIGNINALKYAKALKANIYVPGHGQAGSFEQNVQAYLKYLIQLKNSVTEGYNSDLEDYEIKNNILVDFMEYQNWVGFDTNFGKHINKVYLEIEAL